MRTRNSFRNSVTALGFQVITLIIGLIIPRWIISVYGSEVNGLTSNINYILSIINLLQAGMVGAAIFEMYKPISQCDDETIANIYFSTKKYFRKMSIIFGCFVTCIIPYMLMGKETSLNTIEIVLSIMILGSNAIFLFRYYCSYDVIFSANQQKYILTLSLSVEKMVYYVILFIVLYGKWHYILMYVAVLIGSIARMVFLKWKYNIYYKERLSPWKHLSNYKVKNQYKLFGNQIIQNIIESLPVVLVTYMKGLVYASIISVYLMVANIFKMIFATLQHSIAASFGDYVATNDKERVGTIFNILQYIFTSMSIFIYLCMMILIVPFVKIYTSGISEMSYVYVLLGIMVTFYAACYSIFLPYNMAINTLGLYDKVIRNNIIVGVISIFLSIILCMINFELIFAGPFFFYMASCVHRFCVLKQKGIPIQFISIVRVFMVAFILVIGTIGIELILPLINNWIEWGIYAGICVTIAIIVVCLYTMIFERKQYQGLLKYICRKNLR